MLAAFARLFGADADGARLMATAGEIAGDPDARALAFTLAGVEQEPDIHVMMNMYWQPLEFELPSVTGRSWFRTVDTALLQTNDFSDPGTEVSISGSVYLVSALSVVVLVSK